MPEHLLLRHNCFINNDKKVEFSFFWSIMLQRKEKDKWLGMKRLFFIIYIR